MIRKTISFILVICVICLTGCQPARIPNTREPTFPEERDPTPEHSDPTPVDPSLVTFEDGLVSVEIKDGRPEISFNHALWDMRYSIYDSIDTDFYTPELLQPGPFPVSGLPGAVKGACIGMVAAFDRYGYDNFIIPTVVFLMEDGALNMTLADPFTQGADTIFYSLRIPWLKDIVSLSYENDSVGEKTIYATDDGGLRYDLRIPYGYGAILSQALYCEQPGDEFSDYTNDYLTLTLSEDGTVIFEKYWGWSNELYETYYGTYALQLAENSVGGQPQAGDISFDLQLGWWIWEWTEDTASDSAAWEEGQQLDGVYSSKIGINWDETTLSLEYREGNGLMLYYDHRPTDALLVFSTFWEGPSHGGVNGDDGQVLTMEEAMDFLYGNYVDAELYYPGELDKLEDGVYYYCFVYDDGETYCYVYVNSVTGDLEFFDEIVNYTGEE